MSAFTDWLIEMFPINRTVALLSPILVGLSATVSTWLVDHLPFIADQVNGDQLAAVFIATAAAGVGVAYKWLDNWGKHEARLHEAEFEPGYPGGSTYQPGSFEAHGPSKTLDEFAG